MTHIIIIIDRDIHRMVKVHQAVVVVVVGVVTANQRMDHNVKTKTEIGIINLMSVTDSLSMKIGKIVVFFWLRFSWSFEFVKHFALSFN